MASTFTGLNISSRALYSSQASMYTANANVSNAANTSYTRQVAVTASGSSTPAYFGSVSVSSGSLVTEIERQRDAYLDGSYRDSTSAYGEWYTKSKTMTEVEGIFDDPSDTGLSQLMSDFYSTMESLASDPESTAVRTELLEATSSICDSMNSTAEKLQELQDSANDDIELRVDEINSIAEQLAYLNGEIRTVTLSGASCNELCDQQDELIDRLSELTDVTAIRSESDSQCQVLIDGYPLVKGTDTNVLTCTTSTALADGSPAWDVTWEASGNPVTFESGELKALMDLRDGTGEGDSYNGIPYYLESLDTLAQDFARLINEGVSSDGTDLGTGLADGYTEDGTTGIRLLTASDASSADFIALTDPYGTITAANISLSSDVAGSPAMLGASTVSGEEGNSLVISELVDLFKSTAVTEDGSLEDAYTRILTTEGAVAQRATRMESHTLALQTQAETNRLAVTSVSVDEESNNLVQYEKIYDAAAQMISVWKDIFDVTINVVGG